MSRVCSICNKSKMSGNTVSHSNRKARKSWNANVQKVKLVDDNGRETTESVCTRCLRTMKKSENN